MEATQGQRWRDGREAYRPAGETIQTADYDVAPVARDVAKAFVLKHHYSGSFPAARFNYGLWKNGELQGVAVYSVPVSDRVITNVFPIDMMAGVELGRLVLLDEVPGNGESWFVARTFRHLRESGIAGVVSFSDPMPRVKVDGTTVLPGHVGFIYQALSATYLGRGDGRTLHVLPDGTVFNHRAEVKIRKQETGWEYAVASLIKHGAEAPAEGADLKVWLSGWLARLTRPLKHRGNHKYAFPVDKALRKHLAPSLPYPKKTDAA